MERMPLSMDLFYLVSVLLSYVHAAPFYINGYIFSDN